MATDGKKWLKELKYERNDVEIVSFHYWTRLDELMFWFGQMSKTDKNNQIWAKSGRTQRCRSVFNIGGYNSAFLPFFRDFEILGGIFRFCRFFKF